MRLFACYRVKSQFKRVSGLLLRICTCVLAGKNVYRTQNFKGEKIRSRLLQIKNSSTLSLIIGHGVYDALITVFASALL